MKGDIIALIALSIILVLLFGAVCVGTFNEAQYTVTVSGKERAPKTHYVFCEDDKGNYHEFVCEDVPLRGLYYTSKIYNEIEIGETYEFTVIGYRIPFFGICQKIISVRTKEL
jgi:hypothetical protein